MNPTGTNCSSHLHNRPVHALCCRADRGSADLPAIHLLRHRIDDYILYLNCGFAIMTWMGSGNLCKLQSSFTCSSSSGLVCQANPGNRLLELRSNAGTHDVDFGLKALADLRACRSADHLATVPRYDKSANHGRGTRADKSTWPRVHGPVDVILFEGWMLGFSPVQSLPLCLSGLS